MSNAHRVPSEWAANGRFLTYRVNGAVSIRLFTREKLMKTMNYARRLALGVSLIASAGVGAADFNGSASLTCTPSAAYSCEPGKACSRVKPESDPPRAMTIDARDKTVRAPYRTELLPIANSALNNEQLQLQGTAEKFAWSAVVQRRTGKVTITIADRLGAYVIFGDCQISAAAD
jgi:hypothetical protein